jgi:hypothetical protein
MSENVYVNLSSRRHDRCLIAPISQMSSVSVSVSGGYLNEFQDFDVEGPCLPYVNINHCNQGLFKPQPGGNNNFNKKISMSLQNVRSPQNLINQFNLTFQNAGCGNGASPLGEEVKQAVKQMHHPILEKKAEESKRRNLNVSPSPEKDRVSIHDNAS